MYDTPFSVTHSVRPQRGTNVYFQRELKKK